MNDEKNNSLYLEYTKLAQAKRPDVIFGGRLGKYKYLDMDKVIIEALADAERI
jgi:UDP-galactopyranose mutase